MNKECAVGSVIDELEKHGSYASVTEGVSMRPLFRTHRDVVILKPPSRELKKYDVVLYTTGVQGKYLLHRIVKVLPDEYLIRGDNTYILEHVKPERIIAILTEYNRKGKRRSVDTPLFKLYSVFWNFIYPIRFLCHKLRRMLARIYRGIFKFKKAKKDGEGQG